MKKLLFILNAALVIVSCDQGRLAPMPEQGPPIAFDELTTRAIITDDNFSSVVTEFGVWAEVNTTAGASDFSDLLTNERVYKNGASWMYDNVRYWLYDRTFNFFAYWPYTVTGVEKATLIGNHPGYKVPFTMTDAADRELLYAHNTCVTETGQALPGAVNMNFEHALSQLNFKVAKNSANVNNRVILNKLVLSGVKNKANYYTTRDSDSDYWEIAADASAIELYPAVKSGELSANTPGGTISPVLQNPLLVIPQQVVDNTMLLSIEYSFYDVDPETHIATLLFKTTVNKHIPAITWEQGKSYMYNLTLDPVDNDILFGTPTIASGWGTSVQTGGTLIIR